MWPEMAKFRHLGKNFKSLWPFLEDYCGNCWTNLRKFVMLLGKNLTNNKVIWSHWLHSINIGYILLYFHCNSECYSFHHEKGLTGIETLLGSDSHRFHGIKWTKLTVQNILHQKVFQDIGISVTRCWNNIKPKKVLLQSEFFKIAPNVTQIFGLLL